ncbi:MAG: hypothetical protein M1833_002931 [Piccolia ochrophora]|nr:MAG: hypothetical protein M1833_002931 [Piccolia ochrophora]
MHISTLFPLLVLLPTSILALPSVPADSRLHARQDDLNADTPTPVDDEAAAPLYSECASSKEHPDRWWEQSVGEKAGSDLNLKILWNTPALMQHYFPSEYQRNVDKGWEVTLKAKYPMTYGDTTDCTVEGHELAPEVVPSECYAVFDFCSGRLTISFKASLLNRDLATNPAPPPAPKRFGMSIGENAADAEEAWQQGVYCYDTQPMCLGMGAAVWNGDETGKFLKQALTISEGLD